METAKPASSKEYQAVSISRFSRHSQSFEKHSLTLTQDEHSLTFDELAERYKTSLNKDNIKKSAVRSSSLLLRLTSDTTKPTSSTTHFSL